LRTGRGDGRGLGVERGNIGGERITTRRAVRDEEGVPAHPDDQLGVAPRVERAGLQLSPDFISVPPSVDPKMAATVRPSG
jgi:hypothetical protein